MKWFWKNRRRQDFTMEQLYKVIGYDRRYLYFRMEKERRLEKKWSTIESVVGQVRKDHPGMGLRLIWEIMKPRDIGRDEFIELGIGHGLGILDHSRTTKTTKGGSTKYPNKIKDKKVTGVNQVWVSDITYYWLRKGFYYLTFIMDLFSRKIIGYAVSKNIETEQTSLPALKYAIKTRVLGSYKKKPIFHSDGGGQYYDKEFTKLLRRHGIESSMSAWVYENPHIERFHRTIKEQYIENYGPINYPELVKSTMKAIFNYNRRPHKSLRKLSPNEYESNCKNECG